MDHEEILNRILSRTQAQGQADSTGYRIYRINGIVLYARVREVVWNEDNYPVLDYDYSIFDIGDINLGIY